MNGTIAVSEKDEIVMKLVHYFITKENYAPIMVNGVKNEIWLENLEAHYKIIRINSNYIHNIEQLDFDRYKIQNVNKQIGKKTLTRKLRTLNILTDTNDNLEENNTKDIDMFIIKNEKDLENKDGIKTIFPNIIDEEVKDLHGLDFLVNVSNDINKKTEKDNKFYENVFKQKKIIITKALIIINVVLFVLSIGSPILIDLFKLNGNFVKNGDIYRLITSGFFHVDLMHLICNMYSLNIIGTQIENFLGKKKFILIYFISLITGSLISCVVNGSVSSIGASGAIFGLLGSLVYFGYHYRLYLGSVLKNQIIPIIFINLGIGLVIPNINMAAHVGGLVGGILATMMLGIDKKTNKQDKINGTICLLILIIFMCVLLFK